MIKNYFKIAFRGFRKHKLFTAINIVGLSIGISAALVIYLIASYDLGFDKFHSDAERIYRVTTDYSFSGEVGHNGGVTMALPAAAREEATGIDIAAPLFMYGQIDVYVPKGATEGSKLKNQDAIVFADGDYFRMFNYKWLAGSPKNSLKEPNTVVLTTERAKLYFPKLKIEEMIGKEVIYDDSLKTTVTGVIEPLKGRTDLTFHDFISYITGTTDKRMKDYFQVTQWTNTNSASQLFIKLSKNAQPAAVLAQLNQLKVKHHKARETDSNYSQKFGLQSLLDLHFDQVYYGLDGMRTANKKTLYGLLAIAAFLLLLGCINFINLTTAQAAQRAKEIGIRKTMGSKRSQLILQFLSETFLITLFAVIVSIGLTPVILKLFADFIPKGVELSFVNQPGIALFLLVITIAVSALAGFYPALVLSGYKPVTVLKNQAHNNSSKTRNAYLRKGLTVTQFVIAQFFIMATILVTKQIHYALTKDLGFNKEAVLNISTPWKYSSTNKYEVFRNKISSLPQIAMLSVGGVAPSSTNTMSSQFKYIDGKKEVTSDVQIKYADTNYAKIYKLRFLSGRNLAQADTNKALIINNTYLKVLGFKKPQDAIGKQIEYNNKKWSVVGVIKDFYQKSLHDAIKPLVLIQPQRYNNRTLHLALKPQTAGGNEWKVAIAKMEKAWKEVFPEEEFKYTFFDEAIAKFYTSEQQTSKLLTWATGLSIFISCLGLLGLAIYTTGQRTKEIGVRKVLGASVAQIVTLLSTELVMLIVLAFVLVTPVAWWAMNNWMQNFIDRTPISWWIFAISGFGMLLAALFTLSFQTVKAAIANPVKSLRSE